MKSDGGSLDNHAELLRYLAETCVRLGLSYAVTGSTATIAYGEPRFTNDIDVVIDLPAEKIDDLVAAFPEPGFYVSATAVRTAVFRRHTFNVIQPMEGLKIDVYVAADSDFDRQRLVRARDLSIAPGSSVRFASAEDVILKKLQAFREGGSDKHLRDIAGVLKVQKQIDKDYVADWAQRLGVAVEWQTVLAQEQV